MGKLKDFLRKALKPAAMAAVAGSVALSLVVTTPSNAEAFVGAVPALPAVFGGTVMAIPELVPVAAILGPVAVGLAAATAAVVVGVALYETRDTWGPWVAGLWGQAKTDQPSVAGTGTGYGGINSNFSLKPVQPVQPAAGLTSITLPADYACPSSCILNLHIAFRYQCKEPNGTIKEFKDVRNISNRTVSTTAPLASENFSCVYTSGGTTITATPIAAEFGVAGDGQLPLLETGDKPSGPKNHIYWGEFAQGGFDPKSADAKYTTYVECIDSAGTLSVISRDWTGDSPGMVIPSCAAAGKGHGTGKMWLDGYKPGSTTPTRLWDVPAPTPTAGKELCAPTRASSGCKLAVKIDGKECVVGLWECENWQEINQNDPGKDGTSPRVSCQYGPYAVPLNTCNPLERAYEPDGAPVSEPNVDGNPATRSNTNLDGNPQPQPQAARPLAVPGGAAPAAPQGSSTEQAECFPQGWAALNPVEWVMKPVGCALDAAFKPKKDVQARVTGMQSKFNDKVPISWFNVGNVQGVSGGGCPTNWALDISGQHVSLICGTPVEGIVLAFRPILGAMLVMAALWPLIRSLFYAAIPIFKVTPS